MDSTPERLRAVHEEARACVRCPQLVASRTQVVVGGGDPAARLMLVGEAPGPAEDERGTPLVGRAGALLEELLGEVGLARADVVVSTLVRCRPPAARAPLPAELAACRRWLDAEVEVVRPVVLAALGSAATKLLREDPAPILAVHGQDEVRVVAGRAVRLLPLLHPAAALYTPAGIELLRAGIARVPALLALGPPDLPAPPDADPEPEPEDAAPEPPPEPAAGQLGLF